MEVYHTMPRIPAELIESIKRDVPCRQVLEASGSVFAKHGADIVCVCPFHADKTPSLIISEIDVPWHAQQRIGSGVCLCDTVFLVHSIYTFLA